MRKRKLKKGDEVVVLAGKEKGRRGVILQVVPCMEKVTIENINMVKCHTKGNPTQGTQGGIVEKEMPLHISNVAIWNPILGRADRVGVRALEDGRKVRFFKKNDEVIDA